MPDPWESLRLLSDPTRARLLFLLAKGELAVGELQEILGMGQSRISTHLALLRKAGLAEDRRDGKHSYYSLARGLGAGVQSILEAAIRATEAEPATRADQRALQRIVERRRRKAEQHFNLVADRLGKNYCPGRSWEAIGQMLLLLARKCASPTSGRATVPCPACWPGRPSSCTASTTPRGWSSWAGPWPKRNS